MIRDRLSILTRRVDGRMPVECATILPQIEFGIILGRVLYCVWSNCTVESVGWRETQDWSIFLAICLN